MSKWDEVEVEVVEEDVSFSVAGEDSDRINWTELEEAEEDYKYVIED